MKIILFYIILAFAIVQTGYAQDLNKLITDLSKTENVHYERITSKKYDIAVTSDRMEKAKQVITKHKISSIEEILLDTDFSIEKKSLLHNLIENVNKSDEYEILTALNSPLETNYIIIQKEKKHINNIIAITLDNNEEGEISIFRISGKMKESDVANILNAEPE